jgi:hypothetical protein
MALAVGHTDTIGVTMLALSVKLAGVETPVTVAVADSVVPTLVGVAVMLACPLLPVAATPLDEKLIPAEAKVTVAPGTGMAGVLASVTSTTSELLNAVPTVELCPLPETTLMAAAVPAIFSVAVPLEEA